MRLFICLMMVTTLSSGCWRHRAHRLRSYNACVGCDEFEAPVMTGPNRKEVRELRKWYRQLNREETLAQYQQKRLNRRGQKGGRGGVCPCCHGELGTAEFGDYGMCGDACGYGTDDFAYAGDFTSPDMLGYTDGLEGDWEYAEGMNGQTVYDDGMYSGDISYEGELGGTYCPHCQQQQPASQLPPVQSFTPTDDYEYIAPQENGTSRTVPPVTPTPMEPTPMPPMSPMPMDQSPMINPPITDDFVPNNDVPMNETSYRPRHPYSPPPLPLPAPSTLPAPILSQERPVQQTRWTPTR